MSTMDSSQPILPPATPAALAAALPGVLGPAQGPETAVGGITAADVWRVMKQRKVMIFSVWCALYVLIVATTFFIYRFFPAYRNEAFVRLIPPTKEWGQIKGEILPKDYVTHVLATEAAQILSPAVLLDVLALPEIKETQFYKWYGDNFDKCLYDFERLLDVAPVRDSFLVRASIAVRDRKEARLIVNRLVERYVGKSRTQLTDEGRRRLESLKNTKAAAEDELRRIRERSRQLRERRDMPAIEAERDVMVDTVAVLQNTMSELQARRADIEAQMSTVRGVDPRNLPLSAEMRMIIDSDPLLRYYRQQVEALDIQIDVTARNLIGQNHRQMQLLRDQRNGYFQMEVTRREELIDDLRNRQVEALGQELARIRNMMATVVEQLTEKENTQRDLDKVITEYTNLTKDEEQLSKQLEEIGLTLRQAENELGVQTGEGRLEAILAARDPYWPSRPNFVLYLGGGFVLAALAAVGLALLREVTDQALRTPLDIIHHGRLSVLGSIPLLDDEEAELEAIEQATRRAPHSLVAEAFRQIRTHLTFSGPLESQRVLLITSPRPEDGKTACAVNLAVTLAQGNQRVLLIDCNFRRPGLRQTFPKIGNDGLANVLVGQRRLEQVLAKTDVANLDALGSGPMPPNPAELLGSRAMRDLLDAARHSYDRVILDGPPCLLISDALVLATQVDATILVARAANSSKGALRRAREQFQRIGARVIGAILNGVQARAGGYFRQQYREFYEYTSEEVLPRELPGALPEIESDAGRSGGAKPS